MICGYDLGYTYSKDDRQNIFKSSYSNVENLGSDAVKIDCKDGMFYVGDGTGTVEFDKCNTLINKLCLLRLLSYSINKDHFIVTGLPISQYNSQRDKLKEFILSMNGEYYCIDDEFENQVRIKDVLVYPQGASALFSQNINEDVIIVDIGGRTIDVALLEIVNGRHKLQRYQTWYQGMLVLYSKIIDAVNEKFQLTLESRYAENILRNGLKIFGIEQDLGFLTGILKNHFDPIFDELKINYPVSTVSIYLCGGGANILYNSFYKRFPNTRLINNSQFANAIGFYNIGQQAFGAYDK